MPSSEAAGVGAHEVGELSQVTALQCLALGHVRTRSLRHISTKSIESMTYMATPTTLIPRLICVPHSLERV